LQEGRPAWIALHVAKQRNAFHLREAGVTIAVSEIQPFESFVRFALPSVKQAIARGKSLIQSFGDSVATEPVGGHGLVPA